MVTINENNYLSETMVSYGKIYQTVLFREYPYQFEVSIQLIFIGLVPIYLEPKTIIERLCFISILLSYTTIS